MCFFFVKHIQQVLASKNILGYVRTLLIKSMQNLQSMKYPLWINNQHLDWNILVNKQFQCLILHHSYI